MRRFLLLILSLAWVLTIFPGRAESPAFDLAGPKVDVRVKRGTLTLPVSQTPNLLPDDRLWIHPDLPPTQSEHFVLVVVFLRGTTNPPPNEWFTRVETWTPKAQDEGVFVTVPSEAQQVLLFLAPETGGDFNTLRRAVREQPGAFVRAAQDLQSASWERLRLDTYLAGIKITSKTDLSSLKPRAELAARSLGIKINEDCFLKPPDQQASCLSQISEGMVLDDANAQGLVSQIANGSTLDLVNRLSSTSVAGGGAYSAYVGAVVDTAKILSSLHTAHFQYIPALALPTADALNLRLNIPPSFRNPKSVVVTALPPVGPTHPEALHAVNAAEIFCAARPGIVLPAEGAPLLFATSLAHNLALRVQPDPDGKFAGGMTLASGAHPGPSIELPVTADSMQGGLIFTDPVPALPSGALTGQLHGKWGFADWEGPIFHLYAPERGKWAVAPGDLSALVVGREDAIRLIGDNTQCVQQVTAQAEGVSPVSLNWTAPKIDTIEVKVPLKEAAPGTVTVTVAQYGLETPDVLKVTAYEAAASLASLTLSAGDDEALLKGTRLDQVARTTLRDIGLFPADLSRAENLDQLTLKANSSTSGLEPGHAYTAQVELKDGRRLKVPVTVRPARPRILLLSKGVQPVESASPAPVQFGSPADFPLDGRLVFFLKSTVPVNFPRDQKIEVAAADSSFHTLLDLTDGSVLLADASTAQASLQPAVRFGMSAFGPIRVRAVAADGQAGDWLPLGTLVRLPGFRDLRCPRAQSKPCVLSGSNLFLANAIAATPQFDPSTAVPPEFTGTELIVPHPTNGALYIKLRDDPDTVQTLTMPITTISPAEEKAVLPPAPVQAAPAAAGAGEQAGSAADASQAQK